MTATEVLYRRAVNAPSVEDLLDLLAEPANVSEEDIGAVGQIAAMRISAMLFADNVKPEVV